MKKILIISIVALFAFKLNAQTKIIMEKKDGVYLIPCKINGLDLKFIFDTGASDVSISLTEALFMLKNGHLKKEDIGENVYYSIANGDVAKGTKLNIKEIAFAGLKLYNIQASIIHETEAPLLLGQSAISKLGKIQLEGNNLIILNGLNRSYDDSKTNNTKKMNSQNSVSNEFDFKSLPTFSGTLATGSILVLDNPDLINSQSVVNLGTTITILRKENDKFYFVKSGNVTGYVFVGYIMIAKKYKNEQI